MRLDYYELLNCERGATEAELKNGYRAMAKKYHPDLNAGDAEAEERFKLVAEAYRVLGDPEKRADYDTWLDRHAVYAEKPELESMRRRPARFSAARARARRENRESRRREREEREARRRPRRFGERPAANPLPKRGFLPLLNLPRVKLGTHPFLPIIYALAVVCFIVPPIVHHYRLTREAEERKAAAAAEQKAALKAQPRKVTVCARTAEELMSLPAEMTDLERRVNYLSYTDNLIRAAHRGDAKAQVRYGMLLYTGQGEWFDAERLTRDASAAYVWWERAAALGDPNAKGLHTLKGEAPRLRLVELPPGPTDDYAGDLPL